MRRHQKRKRGKKSKKSPKSSPSPKASPAPKPKPRFKPFRKDEGGNSYVNAFKNGLGYVYIHDGYSFDDMLDNLLPDNVGLFADEIVQLIVDGSLDAVVFDFLHKSNDDPYVYDDLFQKNLKYFFQLLRSVHTGMLFGLKIHNNIDVNKSVFDMRSIDEVVDIYVVNTYDYTKCSYHDAQAHMAPAPSPEEIQKTVDDLKNGGYDINKLFITIKIVVKSWKKNHNKHGPADWSYAYTCRAHPGRKRKFCRGTLDNFYEQGKLVFDNKLPGVFIEAIDCDDFLNTCGCGPFPATQTVMDGLNGSSENQTLKSCTNFGVLPRDRKSPK